MDNYTEAIIYINDEYKEIHDKEIGEAKKTSQNDAPNDAPKLTERQERIISMIRENNTTSKEKMVNEIGCSESTIQRELRKLRKEGYILYKNQGAGVVWYLKI